MITGRKGYAGGVSVRWLMAVVRMEDCRVRVVRWLWLMKECWLSLMRGAVMGLQVLLPAGEWIEMKVFNLNQCGAEVEMSVIGISATSERV